MIRNLLSAVVLAALAIAAPAHGHKPLKAKELNALDGTKGYILVRVGPGTTTSAPIGVVMARMDPVDGKPLIGNEVSKKDFNVASVGGGNFLSSDGKTRLFIVPVNPGKWVITNVGATFYTLGSYAFDVSAGEIVDAGTFLVGHEDGKSPVPELAAAKLSDDLATFGTMTNIVMTEALSVKPNDGSQSVPEGLGLPLRDAVYEADVRFDNVYHGLINRALGLPPLSHNAPRASSAPAASAFPVVPVGTAKP